MKRLMRPEVEPLESKALLSAVPVVGPASSAHVLANPVSIRLTTDSPLYRFGQPVHMTLTETNTSNHKVRVAYGPSDDGFHVTQYGKEVWRSNTGPQPLFLVVKTLRPRESISFHAVWDGKSNEGPPSRPTGPLEVHSELGGNTVYIAILP